MQQTPTVANTAAANARSEIMAVLTTVDELVARAHRLTRIALDLQDALPAIADRLNQQEAVDNVWVRANARTPAQVEAEHAAIPHGTRPWWVVWIGREPGLYTTVEAADAQIKGCPNQQYRRRASKVDAINLYRQKYDDGEVAKWVEFTE
ncbi:hypothetical protein B0H13DRAFT_1890073 [Mycena leptocephala]|nr:hypothetical protein B0H13DRAFT_1890073 [Mycena leptocephala]